jgi:hypothetical protein
MFEPKSIDGLRIWNQSEIANALDSVDGTIAKLLGYLPHTAEGEAYRNGARDAMDSVAGIFGLVRHDSAA